ncbi:Ff.00g044270.m01.CDS01 [Fusarium sp. VM40]|nr:Ff.00g044270.m01.CDS01 [Fusarium sp. VM40]
MTMSPEADSAGSSTEQAEAPPRKKPSRKVDEHDRDAVRAKQNSAIACILPLVKERPELYHQVVDQIKKTNLRSAWSSTTFYRDFMSWCRVSAPAGNARPDLGFFLAVLAVNDSLDMSASKMSEEIRRLGLREWAEEQLKARRPFPPIEEQSPSEVPQVTPRVKVEQRESTMLPQFRSEDGNNDIRQSIEFDSGYQHTTGLKRPSLEHPVEPTNKRVKIPIDPALAAANLSRIGVYGAPQQRIVLHHASTQTEGDATLSRALEPILEYMKKLDSRMEALEERDKNFPEHMRTLQDHNRVLREVLERTRDIDQLRVVSNNNTYYQQSQPQFRQMVPVQSAPPQATAFILGTDCDTNNSGAFLTFHNHRVGRGEGQR